MRKRGKSKEKATEMTNSEQVLPFFEKGGQIFRRGVIFLGKSGRMGTIPARDYCGDLFVK